MAESKYRQLIREIIDAIENGIYTDKLPSELELCEHFSLSRQTVRNAFSIMENMGYISRRQGSGTYINKDKIPLKTAKNSKQIGVITTYITDYIFPAILRGIEGEISAKGYSMLLGSTYNSIAIERGILEEYISSPPGGLIVEGTKTALPNPNIALYEKLQSMGVAIVFINGYYSNLDRSTAVLMNDAQGGKLLVDYLYKKGRRKLAGIFKSDDMQGIQRYEGFVQGILQHGLELREQNIRWFSTETRKTMSTLFLPSLIDGLKDCDGLLCYNDEVAVQLMKLLEQNRQKLEIVSFDHSNYASFASKAFLSLPHPKAALGRLAAQKLMAMMEGKKEGSTVLNWSLPKE